MPTFLEAFALGFGVALGVGVAMGTLFIVSSALDSTWRLIDDYRWRRRNEREEER